MIRRTAKTIVLAAIVLSSLVVMGRDVFALDRTEKAASSYLHGIIEWEILNFPSKWVHRVITATPWTSVSMEEKQDKFDEFFELGEEIGRLNVEGARMSASQDEAALEIRQSVQAEIAGLRERQGSIRSDVEEYIESQLSSVVKEEGLSFILGMIWPPTDVRLEDTPKVLITSPRDEIERRRDVLLRSAINVEEREALEDRILEEQDLSALVSDIGGIATYPAIIPTTGSKRGTLEIAAHEWLHHYFFFRPLGQHFWDNSQMASLNETAANLAGEELGTLVCMRIVGDADQCTPPEARDRGEIDSRSFDFAREMRETRLEVDRLLADGMVEEAEEYMEERRRLFVENGYLIRKLNQAYFAFHGTYADTPASVSPIGSQLEEMRSLLPSVGEFVRVISGMSSYDQFLSTLDELRAESNTAGASSGQERATAGSAYSLSSFAGTSSCASGLCPSFGSAPLTKLNRTLLIASRTSLLADLR